MPVTKDKNGNVKAVCNCGKEFVIQNKYGIFCEDMCGLKESEEAKEIVDGILDVFLKC